MIKVICQDENGEEKTIECDYIIAALVTNTGAETINYKFLDAGDYSYFTKAGAIQALAESLTDAIESDSQLKAAYRDVSISDGEDFA